ncbi:GNAT family N-acetyltransferase [Rhodoplanes serenus]|uniref:GNAT family N-acetyltransferase n=1 Tax=Rhodoplanes serenus TaxID=200615 RepID=UPI001AECC0F4|nr:GNAT family N-acetyltransferase [Rhodoplanes serenus]
MTAHGIAIRAARPDEAAALTRLCLTAKAIWGYDETFMAMCAAELTITPDRLASSTIAVAARGNDLAGLVEITVQGRRADLEKIFVAPRLMGQGVGRVLWDWAVERASASGATEMHIVADPGAAGFYRRLGAVRVGWVPSGSIPGRLLPHLMLSLPPAA